MNEYLEDCDNLIIQVLAEFSTFIFVVSKDSKNSRMLHNVLIESRRLHVRVLADFFSSKRNYTDDLIYSDLIDDPCVFTLPPMLDSNVKQLINKHAAHLSKKRGMLPDCSETEKSFYKKYVEAIGNYITVLDENIKPEYYEAYHVAEATRLRNTIMKQMIDFCAINSKGG